MERAPIGALSMSLAYTHWPAFTPPRWPGIRPALTHEAQQYRASGLNLVIAAIVWWNSTYMADAVAHLRAIGETAPENLLAHTSPVGWEHIAFSGDFLWDRAAAIPPGRRALNIGRSVRQAA